MFIASSYTHTHTIYIVVDIVLMAVTATVLGGHGTQHGPGAALPGDGGEELQATAPPVDKMDTIQGYSGQGFDGSTY